MVDGVGGEVGDGRAEVGLLLLPLGLVDVLWVEVPLLLRVLVLAIVRLRLFVLKVLVLLQYVLSLYLLPLSTVLVLYQYSSTVQYRIGV